MLRVHFISVFFISLFESFLFCCCCSLTLEILFYFIKYSDYTKLIHLHLFLKIFPVVHITFKGASNFVRMQTTHSVSRIHLQSHFCSLLCWFSVTGASAREHVRAQDTSCHVLIQLLWYSKYPCLFILVELHIHHNYVNQNPHSAFYKQLHCELEAFGGRRDQGN